MNTKRSTTKKTDSKSEKNAFWRKKSAIAKKHMKRAKATGNGGWVKMLKKRISKYKSKIKENVFDHIVGSFLNEDRLAPAAYLDFNIQEIKIIQNAINSLSEAELEDTGLDLFKLKINNLIEKNKDQKLITLPISSFEAEVFYYEILEPMLSDNIKDINFQNVHSKFEEILQDERLNDKDLKTDEEE